MNSGDPRCVIDLFHEVLEQDPGRRAVFIGERFGSDPDMAARLGMLLAGHERAERAEKRTTEINDADRLQAEMQMPESIGSYRLLEQIGEGGMGVVYAAEQVEPIRRRVAIKVIKVGMDTQEVIARFEAERQVLAMLDHPGIATVIEAGSTSLGRPYFVMELVKGLPLTEFCEKHRLTLEDRLRLFIRICDAVHHAHQRGVIHRDLKPTNVLITSLEGSPFPKVIDFGVAKATASRLSERGVFTEQGKMIGTPEYMSPEQAEMSGLDIDVRSDVYSLGVMLYELLTDALPFESETLRSGGYANIQRAILETDPPRPSVKLASLADKPSTRRGIEGASPKSLRGELDWIVMRAIEKIRTRRYDSARALYKDVERYLADQPVMAGPPGTVYRFRKFIKRHRFITVAGSSALLAAAAGVTGLTVGLINAQQARALADRRADNAQVAAGFLQKILFHVDPEFGGGDLSLLEVIDTASLAVDEDLSAHPEVEASVRESIGVAYRRLSNYQKAEPHLRRSLEIRRELLGDDHLQTAKSTIAMAYLMFEHEGRIDEALELITMADGVYRANGLGGTPAHAWLLLDVGLINLAGDHLAEAERAFLESSRLLTEHRGAEHPDLSRLLRGLAVCALQRGEYPVAERYAREAVSLCEGEGADYIGARAKLVLARVLLETDRLVEAERLLGEARRQYARTVLARHIRVTELAIYQSELLRRRGAFTDAERVAEQCESVRREILHQDHWAILEAALFAHRAGIEDGRVEAAERELLDLQTVAVRRLGDDHSLVISIMRARLSCAHAMGDDALVATREERLQNAISSRAVRLNYSTESTTGSTGG